MTIVDKSNVNNRELATAAGQNFSNRKYKRNFKILMIKYEGPTRPNKSSWKRKEGEYWRGNT